jgi:hypothetical protein
MKLGLAMIHISEQLRPLLTRWLRQTRRFVILPWNFGNIHAEGIRAPVSAFRRMALTPTLTLINSISRSTRAALVIYPIARSYTFTMFGIAAAVFYRGSRRQDVYNILWAVVFGFATLNILSLAARRMEPSRRGLNFGELLAVMVVLISVFLLGWEMMNIFHIFPIRLRH